MIKDVQIPAALQDAMSMQAQAERERQARVILGNSERQVANSFNAAAKMYADNPTAFHLRAMNMLYEGLKRSNATIVIVPSTAVESMQLGAMPTMATVASAIANAQAPRARQDLRRLGSESRASHALTFGWGSLPMRETDRSFGGSIPGDYDAYLVPLLFEPYASDLARLAASTDPERVLETAAGTGVVARALAPLLRSHAHYLVSDLNRRCSTGRPNGRALTRASSGDRRTPRICRSKTELRHGCLSVRRDVLSGSDRRLSGNAPCP